ncbi:hypothetical protein LCGC14_1945070, partial [marine sediment metagenome]
GNDGMRKELEGAGVEHHPLNLKSIKSVVRNSIAVRKLIKRCHPDIIHTHQFASNFYGSVGAIGLHVPVVSHIHNPDMPQPFSRKVIRFFINLWLTDVFITTIEEKTQSLKLIPGFRKKVFVLHNAIDPKNFLLPARFDRKKYQANLSIPRGNFVIGSVGRFSWEKGYNLLLEVFKQVLVKIPNAFLVLVGDGPNMAKLKKMADDLDVSDRTIFTGYRKDTAVFMSLFDIFVVSSKMESFSLASLEAMYLSIPVIITDRLSSKDILSRAAMVVPCSIEGLEKGIISLFQNEKLRKEMSAKGKKMIRSEFTIDTYIIKLEKIYNALLSKKL